jgi:hypothetical protein
VRGEEGEKKGRKVRRKVSCEGKEGRKEGWSLKLCEPTSLWWVAGGSSIFSAQVAKHEQQKCFPLTEA